MLLLDLKGCRVARLGYQITAWVPNGPGLVTGETLKNVELSGCRDTFALAANYYMRNVALFIPKLFMLGRSCKLFSHCLGDWPLAAVLVN